MVCLHDSVAYIVYCKLRIEVFLETVRKEEVYCQASLGIAHQLVFVCVKTRQAHFLCAHCHI